MRSAQKKNPVTCNIILIHACIILLFSLLGLAVNDKFALSILFGGLICLLGNAVVFRHFLNSSAYQDPIKILIGVYQVQILKIVLVGVLFGFVLKFFNDLNYIVLFGTFFFSQLFLSLAPLALKKQV